MSRQRAAELTKMRTELVTKFDDALKAIDKKITDEDREEADLFTAVGTAAAESDLVVAARQLEAARAREQAERAAQVEDPADADTAEVTRVV